MYAKINSRESIVKGGKRAGAGRKKSENGTKLTRIDNYTDLVLSRLARHYGLKSKTLMLDKLIKEADRTLIDSFETDEQLDRYFEDR